MQPSDIKGVRKKLNLNQKEFADKLGTSTRSIINWEKGNTAPQSQFLQQIFDLSKDIVKEVSSLPNAESTDEIHKRLDRIELGLARIILDVGELLELKNKQL